MYAAAFRVLKCCVVALALTALSLTSVQSHQDPGKIDFRRDLQQLLRQYCVACRRPAQQMNAFLRSPSRSVCAQPIRPMSEGSHFF
jgi:hypothetical protein